MICDFGVFFSFSFFFFNICICHLRFLQIKRYHNSQRKPFLLHSHTHTQPFNGLLSGTTRVGRYQKKHSPTHTHPDHRTSFIIFLHLQRSTTSSLFSLRACQSSRTTSLQVHFGLPLGLGPSTSYFYYTINSVRSLTAKF